MDAHSLLLPPLVSAEKNVLPLLPTTRAKTLAEMGEIWGDEKSQKCRFFSMTKSVKVSNRMGGSMGKRKHYDKRW